MVEAFTKAIISQGYYRLAMEYELSIPTHIWVSLPQKAIKHYIAAAGKAGPGTQVALSIKNEPGVTLQRSVADVLLLREIPELIIDLIVKSEGQKIF